MQTWRKLALRYPETEEGTSCDKSAFKARGKAFFFMGMKDGACQVMVKLGESLAEAAEFARREPDSYVVGKTGWVTATFRGNQAPPAGLMERWIDESFRLLAPKQLVAMLPNQPVSGVRKKATAR
jgi:hypothetical protein